MIRPTRRAVLLFAASVPLARVIALAAPSWWALSVEGAALVLAGLASDAVLALRPRALGAEFATPDFSATDADGNSIIPDNAHVRLAAVLNFAATPANPRAPHGRASSNRPAAALCFWTRSATCPR